MNLNFMSFDYRRGLRVLFLGTMLAWSVAVNAAPAVPPPAVAARAYILMDFNSGQVLAESKSNERMEPASLTKLMTAYIVSKELQAGHIKLNDNVTISARAWHMEGSRTFIRVGSQVPLEVLLKGMIVQSGNDATVALAEFVGGSEDVFVSMMNQEAKALGLASTHYANSTGMPDPQHYTTAHDLAVLTQAVIRDFPEHYAWYSIREFTYNNITQHNRNLLLWRDRNVDGVKTGHTESAGFCLVASALQDKMRLISVVLGTASEDARATESDKLLNYGFRFFETHQVYQADQPLSTVRVWKGETENLPLGLAQTLYLTVPRGQYDKLSAQAKIQQPVMAPAMKGAQYGTLNISLDGQQIAARPLVALQTVAEGGAIHRMMDAIRLWFN